MNYIYLKAAAFLIMLTIIFGDVVSYIKGPPERGDDTTIEQPVQKEAVKEPAKEESVERPKETRRVDIRVPDQFEIVELQVKEPNGRLIRSYELKRDTIKRFIELQPGIRITVIVK